jgi:hypothetical protein
MTAPRIYWVGSPKFTAGHPAKLIALVHHRMVGTLRSTDSAFTATDGREASTNFGVGYGCGRTGHPIGLAGVHVHQYVRLGDQAWGNGNWDASGAWDDRYPTRLVNSRTISIEHHDNGGRKRGEGKGVVPEAVLAVSIELDRLLLRGDVDELARAGIRFRSGTEAAIAAELRAIPLDRHHLVDHHYIAGRLKPYCWRPWADDPTGFPQARYLAALAPAPAPAPEETVNSYPVPKVPSIATVPAGTWLYATSALQPSPDNIVIGPTGRDMPYLGQPTSTYRIVEYVDAAGVHSGRAMFAKAPDLTNIRPAPDPTPFSQAQVDTKVDAAEKLAAAAVKDAADRAAATYGA